MKTQTPPNGYLGTKPSPVRPHGWEHEEGTSPGSLCCPLPPAQLSLPPAHSNVPGAKGDSVNTSLLISTDHHEHTLLGILFSRYVLIHSVQPNPSTTGLTGRKLVCVSQDSEAGSSRAARGGLQGCVGFPGGSGDRETTPQGRRLGFDPRVGKIPWRRTWQPTPVFWSGESHGQRLEGYSPWGRKQSDTTERLTL